MNARRALPVILLLIALLPHSTYSPRSETGGVVCAGEATAPILLELPASAQDVAPGVRTTFEGMVTAETGGFMTLRFATDGKASLESPEEMTLGQVQAGDSFPFSVTALFREDGRAAVHVTAELDDDRPTTGLARRISVYAVMNNGRSWVGHGGYGALELQSIDDLEAAGVIAPEEAQSRRTDFVSAPFTEHEVSGPARAFTAQEEKLNRLVGAPERGYRDIPRAPTADITVQGNVQWTDENGNTHPMFGATVSIRDDDGILPVEIITSVVTDVNGDYLAVVDDDDGFGQGDRDIFVVVRAANGWVDTQTLGGNTYVMVGPTNDEVPGGSVINQNFTAPNNSNGESFSVFQAATWHAGYCAQVNGGALPGVPIVWPNGGDGSFYDPNEVKVMIEEEDRWDWDTIGHEYGHYVQDELNITANPGGPHGIGDCTTTVRDTKDEGLRLSWGEGWPTYFAISGQRTFNLAALNVPRVGDTLYQDVEDGSVVYDLEPTDNLLSEGDEVAVQQALYDLWDTPSDGKDMISLSDTDIWNTIKNANPTTMSAAWAALRAGRTTAVDLLIGEVATQEGMGSTLQTPADGGLLSPSNNSMSWTNGVGCSNAHDGDQFTLKFYDANTLAMILTIPGLTSSNHNLTNGQIATITAVTHDVLWGVESSNSAFPPTGPYHSETFAAVVNRPPVADAGPDETVECESHTTTAVQLDGTGSSDPDGDDLSYTWTGVNFDNDNSPTPTGQFPMGSTDVLLTVSDGIESDTDTVTVTVEDTTPPVVSCPPDTTVECTSHQGTPKDHPSLAPFFAGVSATDICDPNPVITDDAPDYFTLGETVVSFIATDASGNADTCMATVTVEDTTPPEITVELDRDVLWPPNHKMADITASVEVEDVCDPNPTFVLTSVIVDEADNDVGVGDGNTNNDVEASIGEADTTLSLRSERQGRGDGRKYSIIYTAMDMSGNTAADTSCVVVPHSMGGNGLLAATVDGSAPVPVNGFSILIEVEEGLVDDPGKILLGNIHGAVKPARVQPVWLGASSESGSQGLLVRFNGEGVAAILAASQPTETLGLSYRTEGAETEYRLLKDINLLPLLDLSNLSYEEPAEEMPETALMPEAEEVEPEAAPVRYGTVEIYSVTGRRVRVVQGVNLQQIDTFEWDGRTDAGTQASNGVYFYRVSELKNFQPRKVVVVR